MLKVGLTPKSAGSSSLYALSFIFSFGKHHVVRKHLGTYIDEDINTIVTPTTPTATYIGPITSARARQLNYHVLSFLGNDSKFMRI